MEVRRRGAECQDLSGRVVEWERVKWEGMENWLKRKSQGQNASLGA
jgi:hypothetical protein